MTEKPTTNDSIKQSEYMAFVEALGGQRGDLDAWLECNDEAEVRAMISHHVSVCERAAYELAAQACEANENRIVKTHPARIEFDPDSMMARKCASAIRALASET